MCDIKLFLYVNLQTLAETFSWPENLMHNNNPMKTDVDGLTTSTEAHHQTPHQKNKSFKIHCNISRMCSFLSCWKLTESLNYEVFTYPYQCHKQTFSQAKCKLICEILQHYFTVKYSALYTIIISDPLTHFLQQIRNAMSPFMTTWWQIQYITVVILEEITMT